MERYSIGVVINTHGIRGEVKIKSETDFPTERFKPGQIVSISDGSDILVEDITIKKARKHKNAYIVAFEEFNNINDVEKYKGCRLVISEEDLFDLEEDEYYIFDLVGLEVVDLAGDLIGKVSEVLEYGPNDVFQVKRLGKKDLLIPNIKVVVKDIDLDKGQIIIDPIKGLIDDED